MTRAARLLLGCALLPSAGVVVANPPVTRPAFVGCPGDGQTGRRPAPRAGRAPAAMSSISHRVAFYSVGDYGVLAPRGWHCIELHGSNGATLIVTPQRQDARRLMRRNASLDGPAVVLVNRYGGTSGRWAVAATVSRMFPQHRDLLLRMEAAGVDLGELQSGRYPGDIIGRTTDNWIEYTTSADRLGLGTDGMLGIGDAPVQGLIMLLPEDVMLEVNVRLPAGDADLARWIIIGVRHANGDNSP